MSHLMASTENLPGYEKIEKVGVGSHVMFHGRVGSQRQGRTEFPALVLAQHPDDGSLELLVFFEPEDMIWERRVLPWSETNPGHCWSPVADQPGSAEADETIAEGLEAMRAQFKALGDQVFGPYKEPEKSVMEHLADFDVRLTALEQYLKPLQQQGRKKGK